MLKVRFIPAAALAVAGLILWAPAALAAAPANDHFDNREQLAGGLPIEVSRSNVDATKESEEFLGTFAAGHSVWFEWEATSDGWVTVGGCDANFANVVGIFTGTAVNSLAFVTSGNGGEGPNCPFGQREYTFKAASGTKYEIAVDGNAFHPPGSPPPITEGTFNLRIATTPPPVNDHFANARILTTQLEEDDDGDAYYFGSAPGYNWNATEEGGEPDHAGGPNGASVWYSWTAPASGEGRISSCCASGLRLGMYVGSSLELLQPIFGGIGTFGAATFTATAGTPYRIVVYGLENPGGEAEMSSFSLFASLQVPGSAAPGGGERNDSPLLLDTDPPQTTIVRKLLKPRKRRATFVFSSTEPGGTFRCRFDKHPFAACASTKTYRNLARGSHSFKVVAVDAAGNVDPSPATARFRVPKPKRRQSRR